MKGFFYITGQGSDVLVKEAKGLSYFCFEHPQILKGLSSLCTVVERVAPILLIGTKIWEVYEAYRTGGDWEKIAFGDAVECTFTLVLGGAIVAAIAAASCPLWAFAAIAIFSGFLVSLLGNFLNLFSQWVFGHVIRPFSKFSVKALAHDSLFINNLHDRSSNKWYGVIHS